MSAKQSFYNNPELNALQGKLGKAVDALCRGQELTPKQKKLLKKANLPYINLPNDVPASNTLNTFPDGTIMLDSLSQLK